MADQRIQCSEEMIGAGHPTKQDTLNRLMLVEHENDGTHKSGNIHGFEPTDSPEFVTVKLSGLSDGVIPYNVDAATGLADGPTKTDVDSAVSLKHAAVTIDGTSPLSLSTQAISLKNNAGSPAAVTAIDIDGTLAGNADTLIATQKATKTYADTKIAKTTNITSLNETGIADGEVAVFNLTNKDIRTSNVLISTDGTLVGDADTNIPTEKAVKTYADTKIAQTTNITSLNETGIADGEIAVFNLSNKDIRTSNVLISTDGTLVGDADTNVPTEKAVKTYTDLRLAKASNLSDVASAATSLSNLGVKTVYISNYADLATAVSTISTTPATLVIDANASISNNLSIPVTLGIRVKKGAVITVATAKTLTINGPFSAGPYQVFSCTGTGKVDFGNGATDANYPEWWGIDGTADDIEINAAIAALPSLGGRVLLGSKSYVLTSPIAWARSSVVLEGQGASTKIQSANTTMNLIEVGDGAARYYYNHIKNLMLQKTAVSTAGSAIYENYVGMGSICGVVVYGRNDAAVDTMFTGITLNDVSQSFVDQNTMIFNCLGNGLAITGSSGKESVDIVFNGMSQSNVGSGVIAGEYCQGIYIENANIWGNEGANVIFTGSVTDSCDNMFVRNSIIDSSGHGTANTNEGIFISYCNNFYIINNWIGENYGSGVAVAATALRGVIQGNYIIQNHFYGINSSGSSMKIDGNILPGNSKGNENVYSGILIGTASSDVSVTNNTVFHHFLSANESLKHGIEVSGSPDNVFVGMNHIYDVSTNADVSHYGIAISGTATNSKYGGNVVTGFANSWGSATEWFSDYMELGEVTAPSGATNKARIYAVDNGAGKTQLMVIFGSGAAQQIAIEP